MRTLSQIIHITPAAIAAAVRSALPYATRSAISILGAEANGWEVIPPGEHAKRFADWCAAYAPNAADTPETWTRHYVAFCHAEELRPLPAVGLAVEIMSSGGKVPGALPAMLGINRKSISVRILKVLKESGRPMMQERVAAQLGIHKATVTKAKHQLGSRLKEVRIGKCVFLSLPETPAAEAELKAA